MNVEQISIFLENKSGRLAEVTRVLSEAGINIRALYLADTADFGILRLIVSDTEKARQVLKRMVYCGRKRELSRLKCLTDPEDSQISSAQ